MSKRINVMIDEQDKGFLGWFRSASAAVRSIRRPRARAMPCGAATRRAAKWRPCVRNCRKLARTN